MKTFAQFQEDANPFNRQPNIGDRLRMFGNTVQSKIKEIENNPTVNAIGAALLNNPRSWDSQFARKELEMRMRGVNPDNPSRMPIIKTNPKINYSIRYDDPTSLKRGFVYHYFGGKRTTEV